MGLPLPAPLVPIAAELGAVWPEADEVIMAGEGMAWLSFSATARSTTQDCRTAVAEMVSSNDSPGLAAFGVWWQRVSGPAGHQPASTAVAEAMSRIWLVAAAYVVQLQLFVYEQLLAYATAKAAVATAETPAGPVLLVLAQYGEAISEAIRQYVEATLTAIEDIGTEASALLGTLMAIPVSVLNSRPLHHTRDRVTTFEDQAPIADRLGRARRLSEFPTTRSRRRGPDFPDEAAPSSVIKDVAQDGTLKRYAVYDADGHLVKRVDLVGRSHTGVYGEDVPTPHVVYYSRHADPEGEVHVQDDNEVRPVHPEELP